MDDPLVLDDRRVASLESRRDTTQSHPVARESAEGVAEAAGVEANIILLSHPRQQHIGSRFSLRPGGALEIGRSPNAEVSLPDVPSVSRNHSRLEYLVGLVVIRDLGSTNGTYVNDRLIDGPTVLRSGDRFQVGAVHFKFLHEQDVEHAYHIAIYDLVARDGLTEIFNKRKFDEEIEKEFSRARRYGRPLSVIVVDVDHFKDVNDKHGHLAGDFVLKQIAARLASCLRAEQILARIGGEEFAILCPETDSSSAALLAEKLRARVAESPCLFGATAIGVTCSFGVAQFEGETQSASQLFQEADRALYGSKANGRNKVTKSVSRL